VADPARRRPHPRFIDVSAENDAFLAFKTELASRADRARPVTPSARPREPRRFRVRWIVAPLMLAPLAAGVIAWLERPDFAEPVAASRTPAAAAPAPTVSSVTIKSLPEGATVFIDGRRRGVTPLQLSLPVGKHSVELRNGAATRKLPLDVEAGVAATQYIEIESAAAVPTAVGRLDVLTEPAGARVAIDGVVHGVTPLTIPDLRVGQHQVTLTSRSGTFNRRVTIAPGATATVVASLAPTTVSVGWVVLESPLELQVFEDGKRLGTGLDRILLPAGVHTLDLLNDQYKYRTTARVEVVAGQTATTKIDVPLGSLSINATPWAEVSIDGRSVGMTPLGRLSVPIGLHEIVWRHPQFGERRQVVSVTAEQPVRLGMDFSQRER
jgi:hypothetical protein